MPPVLHYIRGYFCEKRKQWFRFTVAMTGGKHNCVRVLARPHSSTCPLPQSCILASEGICRKRGPDGTRSKGNEPPMLPLSRKVSQAERCVLRRVAGVLVQRVAMDVMTLVRRPRVRLLSKTGSRLPIILIAAVCNERFEICDVHWTANWFPFWIYQLIHERGEGNPNLVQALPLGRQGSRDALGCVTQDVIASEV